MFAPNLGEQTTTKFNVHNNTIDPPQSEFAQLAVGFRRSQRRPRRSTIIRAAALAEVDNACKPERAQSGVIETTTALDISDAHGYMI